MASIANIEQHPFLKILLLSKPFSQELYNDTPSQHRCRGLSGTVLVLSHCPFFQKFQTSVGCILLEKEYTHTLYYKQDPPSPPRYICQSQSTPSPGSKYAIALFPYDETVVSLFAFSSSATTSFFRKGYQVINEVSIRIHYNRISQQFYISRHMQ